MSRAMKRVLILLLTTMLLLVTSSALAGVAYPGIVSFSEPATGETVEIRNYGDEHFSYMADAQGNLLVVDGSGYLRYVTENGDAYALGSYKTQATERAAVSTVNVNGTVKQLKSKLQALQSEMAASSPSANSLLVPDIPLDYDFVGDRAEDRAKVCTGVEDDFLDDPSNYPEMESTCPLLVLKLQFEDVQCIFSDKQWHDRIFENGITQYYQTVSNGKFTYVPVQETWETANDGVVTVTLPFAAPHFDIPNPTNQLVQSDPCSGLYTGSDGYNYAIYNTGSLYAYAMLAAEDSVDFASFDRNDDGLISPTELAVLVVYSGYEASLGGAQAARGTSAVWAHSWKYNNITSDRDDSDCHYMTMEVGGKRVTKYTVVGELSNYVYDEREENEAIRALMYDYTTGAGTPRQAQYGTAAHELGHDMGLPDLYPTGNPDPYPSQVVYGLSLMAGGSWGAAQGGEPGSLPTQLDPISKLYLGFYDETPLDKNGRYTLYTTDPSATYNILRVNTDDPNIYYLIENRQYTGYDKGLRIFYGTREGGLVIWRVDEEVLFSGWHVGTINNEEGHYGLMPVFLDDDIFEPFWSLDSDPNSIVLQDSPSFTLSMLSQPSASMELLIDSALVFLDDATFDIPARPVNAPLTALDVSGGVSGGQPPFTFSLSDAPDWLHISASGVLSGTPNALSAATSAVVTVTDAWNRTANITIAVGEVGRALAILSQPVDAYALEGQSASFAVSAEGMGLTYQWYRNLGSGWVRVDAQTQAQLNIAAAALSSNGCKYRCAVTDAFGSTVQSSEATLYVTSVVAPPQTGDTQQPMLYAALLALGLAGLVLLCLRRKAARR